jgi:hypothetical protein
MKSQDRIDKVQEIFKIAKSKKQNIHTLAFLFANYNDREFLRFYNEYKIKFAG